MFILYDLIFLLAAFIYLPVYLFKRKFHRSFCRRLGILPAGMAFNRPIWIHAVSVGEIMTVRVLLDYLRQAYPDKKFVISTVTPAGNKIAKTIAKEGDFVTYLPLDFSFIVRRLIDRVNPFLFIIAETEIWPNLIACLCKRNIPIITVNGRISDSSFKKYLSVKFLLKPVLNKISLFCVQTDSEAERFKALGVLAEKIKVTGNMKFDAALGCEGKKNDSVIDYRRLLGLENEEKLIIAASTHPGEEEIVLGVYKQVSADFPNLKLLIAPRHPERAETIEKIVIKYGFSPSRLSQLKRRIDFRAGSKEVFILDTVGQLIYFYDAGDIIFVGGSLVKKGGHNILEPASLGKPVLFGRYMFNFKDIADLFLKREASFLARNREELVGHLRHLLEEPQEALKLGERARELVLENRGAAKRTAEYILLSLH